MHKSDSNPDVLFDTTHSLIEGIGAKAGWGAPVRFAGDRWLVLACEDGLSPIEPYRQVYVQSSIATDFKKVLMVRADGRIECVAG